MLQRIVGEVHRPNRMGRRFGFYSSYWIKN